MTRPSSSGFDSRLADTAVGPVEYDLTDGDGPVVLMSHAGIGGVDQARLLLDWLDPDEFRLLSVSRPGYLGTPLDVGRTIDEQADMFAALLDVLGIADAAVVSLSAGGPAAYLLAARHPNRVRALVAIDSVSGHHEAPDTVGPIGQAVFTSRFGQWISRAMANRKPDWLVKQLLRGDSSLPPDQVESQTAQVVRSPGALAFVRYFTASMNPYAMRKAGSDNDTAQNLLLDRLDLSGVRCPVLIVHGTHDADVKPADAEYAYESIRGAQRYWIENGSHLGFWLNPAATEAQQAARDFVRRHSRWPDH